MEEARSSASIMLITELLISCIRNLLIKVQACLRSSSETLVNTKTGTVTDRQTGPAENAGGSLKQLDVHMWTHSSS